jgi:hypothetical protein
MSQPADRRPPVPDGWGASDASGEASDSSPGRDSSPAEGEPRSSKPRKRITLRISAAALELPGDAPESDSARAWDDDLSGSAELALPAEPPSSDLPSSDLPSSALGAPESADDDDARDGWARSRPSATVPPPPPVRTKSELPPAPKRSSDSTESLRLVSARSRPAPALPPDLAAEMNDRFALGDFTGALRSAELVLGQQPDDVEAAQVAKTSRDRLVQFHLARLGGLAAVLDFKVAGAEVRWLGLDHRAGFLLSLVDGTTTVEEIVDMSGMAKHEALRLLAELLDGGAVTRLA